MEAGGGRIHAIWLPSENLKLDFTIGYDYNDEGGYPYYYTGAIDGYDKENEKYKNYIGKISYDQDCTYRRGLFNTGLNIEYQAQKFILKRCYRIPEFKRPYVYGPGFPACQHLYH